MNIVVTGGKGFIGRKLIPVLEQEGHCVTCVDLHTGHDMTEWESIKTIKDFDVLIHLAAITYVPFSYESPRDMYSANIQGTLNALELCRINGAKMIFNSSYVYGHPQYLPIDEAHPLESLNPYGQSKIIGETLCKAYYRDFQVPIRIFRIFNIYGEGLAKNFLIPKIIDQLEQYGEAFLEDPLPKRDYVHIDDVVRAYIKALDHFDSGCEALNIGSGESLSVKEIGDIILTYFSQNARIHYSGKKRANDVMDTRADIKKARELISWEPEVPFLEGIGELIKGARD